MAGAPPPPNATALIEEFGLPFLEVYSGRTLVNVAIAFIVLNTLAVALRFFSRWMNGQPAKSDDWLLLPSLAFCLALSGQSLALINYTGVGYHIQRISLLNPGALVTFGKFLVAGPVLYALAIMFSKCAILATYLRFFTALPYRIICHVILFVTIGTGISVSIASLAQCRPLAFAWDKTIVGGHCPVDTIKLLRWSSIPNITTDIIMLVLPLPYIWALPTSIQAKLLMASTLAMGSVGLITSIVRFTIFTESNLVDGTWTTVRLFSLTVVEPSMYLISACLLTYRPLFMWVLRKVGLSSSERTTVGPSYGSSGKKSSTRDSRNTMLPTLGKAASLHSAKDDGFVMSPLTDKSVWTVSREELPIQSEEDGVAFRR